MTPPPAGGPRLVLPGPLVPAVRELPGCGWVLARGFAPAWAAPALWAPYTGQAIAARTIGGLATHPTPRARAVAVLRPPGPGAGLRLAAGTLAGIVALYGAILGLALVYLAVFDVRTPLAAGPAYLLAVWPVAAGLAPAWAARHNLSHRNPQPPDTVRVGSLAAVPPGRGAGTRLLDQLTAAADDQQVTLDLTARTDQLLALYTRSGFTPPRPDRRAMLRTPAAVPDPARRP